MYRIHCLVNKIEQFEALDDKDIDRIYLESPLVLENVEQFINYRGKSLYLACPHVFRNKDKATLERILDLDIFDGVLVRNMEELGYFLSDVSNLNLDIVLDSSVYILNNNSLEFINEVTNGRVNECYNSIELNEYELNDLLNHSNNKTDISNIIYGRYTMMISSNCLNKTLNSCSHLAGFSNITDRKGIVFPVYNNCHFCYNVIYNSVPVSLHRFYSKLINNGNVRLDFTIEDRNSVKTIFEYFNNLYGKDIKPPYKEYTNGLFLRGVE